jgi:hypothetical protein
MTNDEWAENIFSSKDIEELEHKYEKIVYNSENGIIVSIGINNEQCMEFCHHYDKSRSGKNSDFESYAYIEAFLSFLAGYLDEHLQEEGLDYQKDYEG